MCHIRRKSGRIYSHFFHTLIKFRKHEALINKTSFTHWQCNHPSNIWLTLGAILSVSRVYVRLCIDDLHNDLVWYIFLTYLEIFRSTLIYKFFLYIVRHHFDFNLERFHTSQRYTHKHRRLLSVNDFLTCIFILFFFSHQLVPFNPREEGTASHSTIMILGLQKTNPSRLFLLGLHN